MGELLTGDEVAARAPGRPSTVRRGFTWTPPCDANPDGTATWTPGTPASQVLAALTMGATWEHAAYYARLHQSTARGWNRRGKAALAGHATLAEYAATDPPPGAFAYVAFHIYAAEARSAPVVDALDQISRASRVDWRAAAHLLRILPQARQYTETTRAEVTGQNGDPIRLGTDRQRALLAAVDDALDASNYEGRRRILDALGPGIDG